jgi:prophage regulatory protein
MPVRSRPAVSLHDVNEVPAPKAESNGMRLLSYADLKDKGIIYSKSRLWELERAGKFSKRVNQPRARLSWVESEIDDYVRALIAARDEAEARCASAFLPI